MRRPSVHKVERTTYQLIDVDDVTVMVSQHGYRTRCGITGGAELLKLDGINNGTSRWCGGCYPSSIIDPRSTSRWESRWTRA